VVVAVSDLEAAAARWLDEFGLDSTPGGVHPAWGTGNRIVPLGGAYIELIAVLDPARAEATALGRRVGRLAAAGDGPLGWCLGTDDLDAVASRLGLPVSAGNRLRPDGTELRWSSAGLEAALADPWRPFFISWQIPPELHPGRGAAAHRAEPHGIAWVEVGCEPSALRDWLGDERVPARVVGGPVGVRAVGVSSAAGEIALRYRGGDRRARGTPCPGG
jgi:hypothetical protein